MKFLSLFQDETGSLSTARSLLFIWTGIFAVALFFFPDRVTEDLFKLTSTLIISFSMWAGGNRAITSVGTAFSKKTDDVTATTDISEKG